MVSDFDVEPIPGLPEALPSGERILWQGAPQWRVLARRAFHVRKLALYFALILTWMAARDILEGESLAHAALGGGWVLVLAHVSIGLLLLLAWGMGRTTVYTITDKRVVMRFGIAVSMTINIPFAQISSAAVRKHPDGSGDIPIALTDPRRVSYFVLWPNVRPWHFSKTQPMLRAIGDVAQVAEILSGAMTADRHASEAGGAAPNDAKGGKPMAQLDSEPAVQSSV